jgi:hypothetical protein
MNISKKLAQTEQFELEYEGEKVAFEAKSYTLTPQFLKDAGDLISYPKAVAEVVTDWDVTTDDAGNKYPIDEENLARLPVPFLTAILNKVAESWSGDKKKQQASAIGS